MADDNMISGLELKEQLAQQWGPLLPLSIEIDNDKKFKRSTFIKCKCLGCYKEFRITIDEILNLHKDGAVCSCGHPSKTQTQKNEIIEKEQNDSNDSEDKSEEQWTVVKSTESIESDTPQHDTSEHISDETEEEDVEDIIANKIEEIESLLGYPVWNNEIEYNGDDIKSSDEILITCEICGKQNKFNSFDEFINGLTTVVNLDGIGKIKNKNYHRCKNCISTIASNNGINTNILTKLRAIASMNGYEIEGIENKDNIFLTYDDKVIVKYTDSHGTIYKLTCDGNSIIEGIINPEYIMDNFQDIKEHEIKDDVISEENTMTETEIEQQEIEQQEIEQQEIEQEEEKLPIHRSEPEPIKIIVETKKDTVIPEDMIISEKNDSLSTLEQERKREESIVEEKKIFKNINVNKNINPYEDSVVVIDAFKHTVFGPIFDSLYNVTQVPYKIIINEDTLDIPIVDFKGGIRVVCINLDDENLYKIGETFDKNVPHAFGTRKENIERIWLYSDSAQYRTTAVIKALRKRILNANGIWPNTHVVRLSEMNNVFYTTNSKVIKEFEAINSPNPSGKPFVNRLGIINALDKNISNNAFDIDKFYKHMMNNQNYTLKDMDMYVVGSIRWIEIDNKTYIKYIITDYTEIGATKIEDGLYISICALTNEHILKYGEKPYEIVYEFDRSSIVSPTIQEWYNKGGLYQIPSRNNQPSWCYIKLPQDDIRKTSQDGWRQDARFFESTMTLINKYGDLIREQGIDIRDERQKNKFLRSLGYVKCAQPTIKVLYISINELAKISSDFKRLMMYNIDPYQFLNVTNISNSSTEQNDMFNQMMMYYMMNANK